MLHLTGEYETKERERERERERYGEWNGAVVHKGRTNGCTEDKRRQKKDGGRRRDGGVMRRRRRGRLGDARGRMEGQKRMCGRVAGGGGGTDVAADAGLLCSSSWKADLLECIEGWTTPSEVPRG